MRQRLERNLRHRWIGGVASGIARFIGFDNFLGRTLIRALFLGAMGATFSLAFWLYVALWVLLPSERIHKTPRIRGQVVYVKEAQPVQQAPRRRQQPEHVEVKRLTLPQLVSEAEGRVSVPVQEKIHSINESIKVIEPQMTWWKRVRNPELQEVQKAAKEYFPQALEHYLNLPKEYAEKHVLASGQTSEQKLLRELNVIDGALNKVVEGFYQNATAKVSDSLKGLESAFGHELSAEDEVSESLERLIAQSEGKVSAEILAIMKSIEASILSVLPQISKGKGSGMTQEVFNIRKTALEYLPDAINKYLNLPANFATSHKLSNGKTAEETLIEQLELLDNTMKDMVGSLYQDDAKGLLVHGRFLKEKFANQKFIIPQ